MANSILTENEIRIFLMDKDELNTLVAGIRFKPEDIEQAIINTVDRFNTMNPPTGISYTVENFPFRTILLLGVSSHLLRSAAINEAGNNFGYSADGVQINDKDKAQIFLALAREFADEFKEMATNIKVNQNVSQCYGTIFSEYRSRAR